jgi:fucose 4-O-acetylase-like acetyltransferase
MMSVLSAIDGDLSSTQHVLMRLVVLAFTTSMLVAILVLVPQRQLFFTHMGAATLTMYLLQEATLLIPRHYIAQWDGWSAPMAALLVIVGAGYALVLGTQPVQRITKWLVDPVGTFGWLRRLAFKESESVSKN